MNEGKKFDICLMNPPFLQGLGEKFLIKVLDISNNIISIQPLTWLLGKKQKTQITKYFDKYGGEIETINGNKYFDIVLNADMSINHINILQQNKLIYNNQEYTKCSDITTYSNDKYLVEFNTKLGNVNNSIWDNIKHNKSWGKGYVEHPNQDWWCVKVSMLRGHVIRNNNKKYSDDFFTILPKEEATLNDHRKGKYSFLIDLKKTNRNVRTDFGFFAFDTEQELNNFIKYLKTDFVRTCLMLLKIYSNQFRGCLAKIPWFDFSDEHFNKSPREIDDWLFKKYNIRNEIRKHIEKILPDYYGIRK